MGYSSPLTGYTFDGLLNRLNATLGEFDTKIENDLIFSHFRIFHIDIHIIDPRSIGWVNRTITLGFNLRDILSANIEVTFIRSGSLKLCFVQRIPQLILESNFDPLIARNIHIRNIIRNRFGPQHIGIQAFINRRKRSLSKQYLTSNHNLISNLAAFASRREITIHMPSKNDGLPTLYLIDNE